MRWQVPVTRKSCEDRAKSDFRIRMLGRDHRSQVRKGRVLPGQLPVMVRVHLKA